MVIQYVVPRDLESRFSGLSETEKSALITKSLKESIDTKTLKYMYLETLINQEKILDKMNNITVAPAQVESKPKPKPTVTKKKPKPVAVNKDLKNTNDFAAAFGGALK